ncbi:hypothetical protein R1sor_017666 [Riccia sorocarpa]|uniref:Large ribosomal subunit protein uL22c n=1 Tax=Riccia sorocarpa TaxID=122646 RepID=A0ABD3IAT7_9MARC
MNSTRVAFALLRQLQRRAVPSAGLAVGSDVHLSANRVFPAGCLEFAHGLERNTDTFSIVGNAARKCFDFQRRYGISTSAYRGEEEEPVRSPLSQAPGPLQGSTGGKLGVSDIKSAQAVLTGIRMSPQKLNMMAEMVRGMRVEDALNQMAVSVKRAAKTVTKVMHSAQANAVHNYGLNKDRLVVAEAFVGKDKFLKRPRPHGKGKAGKMERARSSGSVKPGQPTSPLLEMFLRNVGRITSFTLKYVVHRFINGYTLQREARLFSLPCCTTLLAIVNVALMDTLLKELSIQTLSSHMALEPLCEVDQDLSHFLG